MSEIRGYDSLFRLDGKIALVTGGSRGLGLHMATGFLLAGASKVILTARKAEGEHGINQALDKLNAMPGMAGKAVGLEANCAKVADILKLVDYVKTNFGKLDILVCNAGTSWGSWFDEAPEDASDKILNLNVKGVFHLAQKFAPLLETAGTLEDPSRIIIVSSVAGVTVSQGGPNGTIMYNVSKAAAHHLARNLAVELGPRNITTNTIAPGFFPSKLANGLIEVLGGDELIRSNNPRRRLGEAEDMAALAIYLCSRAGSYVNGADIPLDGGARYLGRIAHPKSKI